MMALRGSARLLTSRRSGYLSCGAVGEAKRLTSAFSSHSTSFGFREVQEEDKSRLVGDVFKSVASNYDLMNDLMSAGLHRLWKDRLVSKLRPFPGMQHLDVAGGTGDVAFRVLEALNRIEQRSLQVLPEYADAEDATRVHVCDINRAMLDVGRQRARERGLGELPSLVWVEGNAEELEFHDESMDGYTVAFGIRNVTHIEKALKEAHRILRRGGRFLCLELSHVNTPVFKQLYDVYSFSVIPSVGEIVANDRDSYQYLVESIRKFPSQENSSSSLAYPNLTSVRLQEAAAYWVIKAQGITDSGEQYDCPQNKFAEMIAQAGFQNVQFENMAGGVVAIHSGFKL